MTYAQQGEVICYSENNSAVFSFLVVPQAACGSTLKTFVWDQCNTKQSYEYGFVSRPLNYSTQWPI